MRKKKNSSIYALTTSVSIECYVADYFFKFFVCGTVKTLLARYGDLLANQDYFWQKVGKELSCAKNFILI